MHAASHPLRFGLSYMECGDWSPLLKALTSQRTPKKEKAAESLAVKLLPPSDFVRLHTSPGSLNRRHVRLGLRLFDRRVLFLNQRLEDSLVAFCSMFRPTIIDEKLTAQSQSTHDFVVTLDVRLLQIIEQAPSLRDHLQQSATGMIVFLVNLEMLGEFVDALA